MTKSLNEREIVLGILLEISQEKTYSHIALNNVLSKYQYLEKKERAFITRLTEGTLERRIELDYIINQFSKTPVRKMKPAIREILRSAVYQLRYMDSVPASAVCNEAVKLAVKKGFSGLRGFVNGVLRSISRNLDQIEWPSMNHPEEYLSVKYSMPQWIVKRWLCAYEKETVEGMLTAFLTRKPMTIRCNLTQIQPETLKDKLENEGIQVERHPYLSYAFVISGVDYLGGLESFRQGDFYIQDISSMLVGELANPEAGAYVLDVCAAPGGKALHVAEKLKGTGTVEARDLTEYKVNLIRENITRSKMQKVEAVCMDATVRDENSIQKADVLIADLPCSGLGILGRKPDLKYNQSEQAVTELAKLQREILSTVQEYVKPGGTLVYSTCTITKEENMENVQWFLKEYPEYIPEDIGGALCEELRPWVKDGCLQLLPGIHQSDGFFIVKLRRREAS